MKWWESFNELGHTLSRDEHATFFGTVRCSCGNKCHCVEAALAWQQQANRRATDAAHAIQVIEMSRHLASTQSIDE